MAFTCEQIRITFKASSLRFSSTKEKKFLSLVVEAETAPEVYKLIYTTSKSILWTNETPFEKGESVIYNRFLEPLRLADGVLEFPVEFHIHLSDLVDKHINSLCTPSRLEPSDWVSILEGLAPSVEKASLQDEEEKKKAEERDYKE